MSWEKNRPSVFMQYAAAITGSLTALGYGLNLSWTSPVIPYLTSDSSHLPITKDQSDIISSLFSLGLIMGYMINPLVIDRISRKQTLLIYSLPQLGSWLIIIFLDSLTALQVGRILCGFGYGGGVCALTVYLSEIGNLKNRGVFLVMIPVFLNFGFLIVMLLGAFSSYQVLNVFMFLVPLSFTITFIFMPDSSHFRKQTEEENTARLLSDPQKQDLEKCFENCNLGLQIAVQKANTGKGIDEKTCNYGGLLKIEEMRLYKLLAIATNRRALLTVGTLSLTLTFSGGVPVIYYTQQLLDYSGFSMKAEECSIILAGITIISCVISIPLVERIRRKVILLYSGILATIGMSTVGIFFLLESQDVDVSSIRWIPLVALTLYQVVSTFAFVNLFYILQGELFPLDVKSLAVTICKISMSVFMFLSIVRFQRMVDILGLHILFFMYALVSATGTYFVFIITPETKGKSVEEIQLLLKSKKFFFFD